MKKKEQEMSVEQRGLGETERPEPLAREVWSGVVPADASLPREAHGRTNGSLLQKP